MSPNLYNNFLNWDDTVYIVNNDLIKDFSFNGIIEIFTTPEVVSTYAPLTLLSWSLDYIIDGLNPFVFHVVNLLLHLLIVGVVFYLAELLSKNKIIAFITALFFGIHPMHVEVVGWISARKDLLYTLFLLGSLIAYYFYINKTSKYPKYYYYFTCLLFFLLSLLAKGTAVILPLLLLLFDYFKVRKINKKLFIEKIPFFILSLFFVILSIQIQDKGGAMNHRQFITVVDSLSIGFYGYLNYLIKVIIPFNLSAYHPYPNTLGEPNPWYYYASCLPILVLFFGLLSIIKKNRSTVFAFAFFFIALIPVIQVLPFGTAVTADRYTYLPYFGVFYFVGLGSVWLFNNYTNYRKVIVLSISSYVILLSVLSFKYSKTFHNGETLWSNVIEVYPDNFLAYMNRAEFLISRNKYTNALADLDVAINLNPDYVALYFNRAFINARLKNTALAFKDLNKVLQKDSSYMIGYLNRGLLYAEENKINEAIKDFTKVIELEPNEYYGYYNRALLYNKKGNISKAIADLNVIITLNQYLDETYYLRGKTYLLNNDINNAFKDFSKTLQINSSFARAHTQRGHLWLNKGNLDQAVLDYNKAVFLDEKQIDAFINLGIIFMNRKQYNKAKSSFEKAEQINSKNYLIYYNKGLLYQLINEHRKAIIEFDNALKLNPSYLQAKEAKIKSKSFK